MVRCVVAIDFGTTNSGAAYCLLADEEHQIKTLEFPGLSGVKVPTTVVLENKHPHRAVGFGPEAVEQFDEDHHAIFHRFKMQLYDDPSRSHLAADVGDTKLETDVVISRCLSLLKDKVLNHIKAKDSLDIHPSEVRWVLTLPAIWSEKAKALMRRAAHKAGLIAEEMSPNLQLAFEPECAALDCHESLGKGLLTEGCRYLVVDCGGGTVDTSAFEVRADKPSLQLHGIHPPAGGGWGSTRIDEKFLTFLRELLDNPPCLQERSFAAFDLLTSVWEDRKVRFGKDTLSNASALISINLNPVLQEMDPPPRLKDCVERYNSKHPNANIKSFGSSQLKIPATFMKTFYQDVLREIAKHVRQLLRDSAPINLVILAGGFGGSSLVQEVVEAEAQRVGAKMVVPEKPWISIVVGAVRFGLNADVIASRRARYTYGSATSMSLEHFESMHSDVSVSERKHWDERRGEYRVDHVFSTFVKKDEEVPVDHTVKKTFFPLYDDQTSVGFKIMRSTRKNVVFTDDISVRTLAEASVDVQEDGAADDKPVDVTMQFGQTEVMVFIKARDSGKKKRISVEFNA